MLIAMQRSAFIFDMDGVLTDNMRLHANSWIELFRDFGMEGMDADRYLKETAGMKGLDVLRYFLGQSISAEEAERLTEFKDFLYRVTSRNKITPLTGLQPFLEQAQQQAIPMGIGTGASPKNIDYVLELLELEQTFQALVDPSQVSNGKPHPDIFLRVASLLGAEPQHCIVFEDALPGIEAARRAGMQCVAITTTNNADEFRHFDNILAIVNHFQELTPQGLLMLLTEKQNTLVA